VDAYPIASAFAIRRLLVFCDELKLDGTLDACYATEAAASIYNQTADATRAEEMNTELDPFTISLLAALLTQLAKIAIEWLIKEFSDEDKN
jgi:hypothetical protein